MAEDQRHVAKRKPRTCPKCGSPKVVAILYGLPDGDAFEEAEAGRLILGGCCEDIDDPQWRCMDCGLDIHRERKPA